MINEDHKSFEGEILSTLAVKYSVTDQQLDAMISDEDLNEISHSLPKWEQVAIQLGLDQHQIRDIQHSFGIRGKLVLTAWKNRQGRQATYRKLVEVLDKLYEVECARQVCHLIRDYGLLDARKRNLVLKYSVTEQQLDATISDEHINEISQFLVRWEDLANVIGGLHQFQITEMKQYPGTDVKRSYRFLTELKKSRYGLAKYRRLVDALDQLGEVRCANQICDLIRECVNPPVLKKDQFPSLYDIELTEIDDSQSEEILKSVDILLMVVNENEYRAVLGLMKPIESEEKIVQFTQKGVTFLIGKYGKYRTAVVQTSPGGQGPDGAEKKTIRAVEVLKPSVVISVGVAYGKSKETQQLGDVLVCNLVHDYTYKRLGENETRIRNPQLPVGGRLLDIFKNCVGWRKERGNGEICRVKVGPLVSGPYLIDNLQEKEKVFKTFPDAIGGEMEGAAIMSAIHGSTPKPEGIVIKAICDWGDGSKNKQWQPFAAHAAADYVLHHMKKEAFADLIHKDQELSVSPKMDGDGDGDGDGGGDGDGDGDGGDGDGDGGDGDGGDGDLLLSEEAKAIIQKSLEEEGKVNFKMVKCLVQGPARVGKTHVKALIMRKKLEEKSPSTDCVAQAVRAICTDKFAGDGESWKEISPKELKEIFAKAMKSQYQQSTDNADSPSKDHSESIDNTDPPSKESLWQSEVATKDVVTDQSQTQDVSSSASKPSKMEEIPEVLDLKLFEELIAEISSCEGKEMEMNWIYFVDSGGQPQFHNVFQAFIQNTSILLLVFSLAEKLSDYNKHLFQDKEGHDHSKNSDNAAPRIDVVMKSIASALCSTVSEEKRKIFFVGTHRDVYENNHPPSQGVLCSLKRFGCRLLCHRYESIEMKERQLREVFGIKQSQQEIKEEEIQTTSTQGSTILFPVNGLQAEEEYFDDKVVVDIRQNIFSVFKETKVEEIPLRWFVFQLALDQKVLTYKKCRSIAKYCHINDSSTDDSSTDNDPIDVALAFLQKCSLLLVYKKLDLVITDPTALLSRFSTMVRKFYSNKFSGSVAECSVAERSLAKKAVFSFSVFEELQNDGSSEMEVLTCEKLIGIFESLLIAVEVSITGRGKYYFVPALLPCSPSPPPEAKVCTLQEEKSSTVPLVFLFSDKCTPSGLFCAVVANLLASKDWEIDMKSETYSNAVTLLHMKWLPDAKINLIDSFKYYEVHCSNNNRLQKVKENVELAIESVIEQRKYKCSPPKIAFFKCKEEKCMGLALLLEDGSIRCHCKRYKSEETVWERKWIPNDESEETEHERKWIQNEESEETEHERIWQQWGILILVCFLFFLIVISTCIAATAKFQAIKSIAETTSNTYSSPSIGARGSIPTKSNPMGTTTANPQEPHQPSTSSGGVDDTDTPTAGAATASAADSEVPPVLKEDQFPSLYSIELNEVEELQTEQILNSVGVLLMVVNENEYSAVLGLMKPIESGVKIIQFTKNSVTFLIGKYGKYHTAVVQTSPGGQGPDAAVQKTVRAIEVVKPSVVISVGVAYGKSKETQRLGDVLVCNLVHDYTYKRLGENDIRIRNPQPPVGGRLLDIFKNYVGWRKERGNGELCSVKVGPLVSDSNLIDSLQEKENIFKAFPDAIGGEMEGAAIMSAIHGSTPKPEGIVIKAICDWGDGSKNKQWQPFAAHAAADYVLHHMKKEAFADVIGERASRSVPRTTTANPLETQQSSSSSCSDAIFAHQQSSELQNSQPFSKRLKFY